MRNWDLITGAARMDQANRHLRDIWNDVHEQWDDETARAFEKRYLEPLLPQVKRAMEAIKRMHELFAAASRELDDD